MERLIQIFELGPASHLQNWPHILGLGKACHRLTQAIDVEHLRSRKVEGLSGCKGKPSMAARANWKGVLKIGEVSCPVALYTAASTVERITFHILNRKTGHRVHREFVDAETGKRIEPKEQIKGYEIGAGDYVPFEPEEIAKAVPEADKTLDVQAFVPCDRVDDVYFD